MPTTPFVPRDIEDLLAVRRGIIAMGEAAGAIERIFEDPDHPIARLLKAAATLALEQVEAETTLDQNTSIKGWLEAFSPASPGCAHGAHVYGKLVSGTDERFDGWFIIRAKLDDAASGKLPVLGDPIAAAIDRPTAERIAAALSAP